MSFVPIITRNFPRKSVINLDGPLVSCAARLSALPEPTRAAIKCIYGHVPYGLHGSLARPAVYITLLRNPVDRLVSAYYYSLRRPEWEFHEDIIKQRLSLHDFVAGEASEGLHNGQTRMLSGSDEPVCTADALNRARRKLSQQFVLAGLTERFDESVLLCRRLLGLGGGFYQRKNVNRHRPPLHAIAPRTVALIEKRNSLDVELYDVAVREFERLIARFSDLQSKLARFRRWNAYYGFAGRLFGLPLNLLRDTAAAIRRSQVRNRHSTKDGW